MYYVRAQQGRKVEYSRFDDDGTRTIVTKAAFDALPRDYSADRRTGSNMYLTYTVTVSGSPKK